MVSVSSITAGLFLRVGLKRCLRGMPTPSATVVPCVDRRPCVSFHAHPARDRNPARGCQARSAWRRVARRDLDRSQHAFSPRDAPNDLAVRRCITRARVAREITRRTAAPHLHAAALR